MPSLCDCGPVVEADVSRDSGGYGGGLDVLGSLGGQSCRSGRVPYATD